MSKLIDTGQYGFYTDSAGRRVLGKLDRKGEWHPTLGRYTLLNSDGSIAEQGEWVENFLANEGEQSVLNVYFLNTSQIATTYLCLLQGTPTQTTTMSTMTEADTPGSHGYARQSIAAADWGAPALDSGDYMTTAASKTFGPCTTTAWSSITYVGLVTTSTGTAGKFLAAVALSGSTTVAVGQSLQYQISLKCKTA